MQSADRDDEQQADDNRAATVAADKADLKSRQNASSRAEGGESIIAGPVPAEDGSLNTMDSRAGDLSGSAPSTLFASASGKVQTEVATTASDALRKSESPAGPQPSSPAAAAQQFAVRIAPPQAPAVDIHMMERGGQIHVAVRTADGGLQTSLRQDLGTLVDSLQRSGFHAESFAPREGPPQLSAGAEMNSQNGKQESKPGSEGRGSNPGNTSQDSPENQSQNGGGQGRQQQRSPKWIEEMENPK
jgi:hypothetical protein